MLTFMFDSLCSFHRKRRNDAAITYIRYVITKRNMFWYFLFPFKRKLAAHPVVNGHSRSYTTSEKISTINVDKTGGTCRPARVCR